jgi:putative transposase
MVTGTITYKLYPGVQATDTLHGARKMHCDLYNSPLRNRKNQYQRWVISISYFDQQRSLTELKKELPEYAELACHSLQNTLQRVDFAYQRFFQGWSKYP